MLFFKGAGEIVVQLTGSGGIAPALGRPPGHDDGFGGGLRLHDERQTQTDHQDEKQNTFHFYSPQKLVMRLAARISLLFLRLQCLRLTDAERRRRAVTGESSPEATPPSADSSWYRGRPERSSGRAKP